MYLPKSRDVKIKSLSIVLIASILIQLFMPLTSLAVGQFAVKMTTTSTQIKTGESVNVNIYVTGDKIAYFEGYLDYDTEVFEEISKSSIYVNSQLTADEDYGLWTKTLSSNKISISENEGTAYSIPDDGLLATLKFVAKKDADTSTITFNNVALVDEYKNDIDIGTVSINVPDVKTNYTITYNQNTSDSVSNMPSSSIKVSGEDCLIADAPTREGYTFTGWNTSAEGNGTSYAAGDTYSTDANLDLYAQWEIIRTTVKVNPNGGVWEGSSATQDITENYGTVKTLSEPTITPNGFVVRFNANGGTLEGEGQIVQTTRFDKWALTGGGILDGSEYTFLDTTGTLTAQYLGNSITLPSVSKTGATFKGWYTAIDGGNLAGNVGDAYTPESATTLFAQWEDINYTLSVNPNGGTWNESTEVQSVVGTYNSTTEIADPVAPNGYTVTLNNNGTTSQIIQTKTFNGWTKTGNGSISGTTYTFADGDETITAEYISNNVELETPIREGYTFEGWYTEETAGTKVETPYMPTEDIELYAHWTANTYTITFNPGEGATLEETTKQVTYDGTYGELPVPIKTGYNFVGWYNTDDSKIESTTTVSITSDITLTAKWEIVETILTVNPNGGTWEESTETQTFTQEYGTTKTISNPSQTPSGYTVAFNGNEGTTEENQIIQTTTFANWTLENGGSFADGTYTFGEVAGTLTANYTGNSIILPGATKTGATFKGWYTQAEEGTRIGGAGEEYIPTEATTLFAQWTANTYTITFNPGEGTTSTETKEVTYGETYGELPIPTRPGYDFEGWYNGETKIEDITVVDITENTTLIAKWLGATYTVTFDANEGITETTSKEVRNEGTYGELPEATRTGYTFKGWYTELTDGTKVESTSTVNLTSNIILYAQWEIIQSTLTVNPNGGEWEGDTNPQTFTENYGTTKVINTPTTAPDGYVVTLDNNDGTGTTSQIVQTQTFKEWTLTGGGSFSESTYTFNDEAGTLAASYTGNNIMLPSVTKTGAIFKGWFTASTEGDKIGEANDTYMPSSNITLYAQWENINYTLSVNPNGGTWNESAEIQSVVGTYNSTTEIADPTAPTGYRVTLDNNDGTGTTSQIVQTQTFDKWILTGEGNFDTETKTYTYGTDAGTLTASYISNSVELIIPTREGYTFEGWYTEETAGTKVETPYMPTEDIELYAHWTANTYTITFNPGEGATVETQTKEVVYDGTYGELPTPVKEGYNFEGWYNGETKIEDTTTVEITENTTLTAQWSGIIYTVTFNANEGITETNSKEVKNGETYGELPEATRIGYTFKGWYTELTDGTKVESTSTVNLTSNITLYAQWEIIQTTLTVDPDGGEWEGDTTSQTFTQNYGTTKEIPDPTPSDGYVVTLEYNNGTGNKTTKTQTKTFDKWILTGGGNFNESTYTYGTENGTLTASYILNSIELDSLTRTGYTFDGWYTQRVDGEKVENTYTPESNITLYARWIANKYTVTFNPGENAIVDTTSKEVTYKKTYGELPVPTKDRYDFLGWYYGDTLIESTTTVNITENITLTAKWKLAATTLTVDPNKGTWEGDTNPQTFAQDIGTTKEITNPTTPNGYLIKLNNNDGTGSITSVRQTQTFDGWTLSNGGSFSESIYTFGEDDGTLTATYTRNSVELTTPTREGYIFDGWYTLSEGGDLVSNTYMPEGDITLYAHWIAGSYTITFNPGENATVDTPTKEVTKGEPYGELPTPVKQGYDFLGWYNGDSQIESTTIVQISEDTTLNAKWEASKYTITFNAGEDAAIDTPTKEVTYGETYGELPTPTKEGYTFIGWYDSNENQIQAEAIVEITSDITINAKYEINKYTVTFLNNDGKTVIDIQEVEHGSKAEYKGQNPTQINIPDGYESEFSGWANADKLNSVINNISVTAMYELTPITYTIEYKNTKDSDNSLNPKTYTVEDENIQLQDLPDQEKYIFKGWYTTDDDTGINVTSIDTSKLENIILYAQWEEDNLYLKSKKYKIGENNIDIYEQNDIYLDKIEPNTTVDKLKENCQTNGTITVIDKEGKELKDGDLVGTNMTIKVIRYDEQITLTTVVMGDLDGNGQVTATDLSTINQSILKMVEIKDAEFKAADLDDNIKITATDLSTINNTILKNITLTYDKTQNK